MALSTKILVFAIEILNHSKWARFKKSVQKLPFPEIMNAGVLKINNNKKSHSYSL